MTASDNDLLYLTCSNVCLAMLLNRKADDLMRLLEASGTDEAIHEQIINDCQCALQTVMAEIKNGAEKPAVLAALAETGADANTCEFFFAVVINALRTFQQMSDEVQEQQGSDND